MKRILFVCTGNVFRSMTAEYAFKRHMGGDVGFSASSAGTTDKPGLGVRDDVAAYLLSKGLDVSAHRRRPLTGEIMANADVVVAMNTDHQRALLERYDARVPLFTEAAGLAPEPLPDVDDLFAPEEWLGEAAVRHAKNTIDRIIDLTPALIERVARQV